MVHPPASSYPSTGGPSGLSSSSSPSSATHTSPNPNESKRTSYLKRSWNLRSRLSSSNAPSDLADDDVDDAIWDKVSGRIKLRHTVPVALTEHTCSRTPALPHRTTQPSLRNLPLVSTAAAATAPLATSTPTLRPRQIPTSTPTTAQACASLHLTCLLSLQVTHRLAPPLTHLTSQPQHHRHTHMTHQIPAAPARLHPLPP